MNKWYPITGGPSSGKTTTVNLLRQRGYNTTIEHARHYIDTQRIGGKTVDEIRAHQAEFQRAVLDMQIEQEDNLEPNELWFLDRALPDALAYYQFLELTPDSRLAERMRAANYRKAFLLDLLPLAPIMPEPRTPPRNIGSMSSSFRSTEHWHALWCACRYCPRNNASTSSLLTYDCRGQSRKAKTKHAGTSATFIKEL